MVLNLIIIESSSGLLSEVALKVFENIQEEKSMTKLDELP